MSLPAWHPESLAARLPFLRRRARLMAATRAFFLARGYTEVDPAVETAYVLMDESGTPAEMRGVGRIYVDESADNAEFSVLVEQSWTRLGLGALLMQRLVDDCRHRHLAEIWGYVLLENRPMLELCKELGFVRRLLPSEPGTAQISLALGKPATPG